MILTSITPLSWWWRSFECSALKYSLLLQTANTSLEFRRGREKQRAEAKEGLWGFLGFFIVKMANKEDKVRCFPPKLRSSAEIKGEKLPSHITSHWPSSAVTSCIGRWDFLMISSTKRREWFPRLPHSNRLRWELFSASLMPKKQKDCKLQAEVVIQEN